MTTVVIFDFKFLKEASKRKTAAVEIDKNGKIAKLKICPGIILISLELVTKKIKIKANRGTNLFLMATMNKNIKKPKWTINWKI